jgi:hypothetical protein
LPNATRSPGKGQTVACQGLPVNLVRQQASCRAIRRLPTRVRQCPPKFFIVTGREKTNYLLRLGIAPRPPDFVA